MRLKRDIRRRNKNREFIVYIFYGGSISKNGFSTTIWWVSHVVAKGSGLNSNSILCRIMLLIWPLVKYIRFFNRLLEGEFDIFFGFLKRNLNGNLE